MKTTRIGRWTNGEVAHRFIGPVTQSDLAAEIEKRLATR